MIGRMAAAAALGMTALGGAQPAAAAQPGEQFQPLFESAPRITIAEGFTLRPRGRLQWDGGWVESPPGIGDDRFGWDATLRRARIGVQGDLPGGFGYAADLDLAGDQVAFTDALLSYRPASGVEIVAGQHNNFQALEELTSSLFTSFMERAAFTDAFNFERRLGLSAGVSSGALRANLGIFTDNLADLDNDGPNSSGIDGRIVYAPRIGDFQLHLGASGHWRDRPAGTTIRYRQRPLLQTTDARLLATPSLPVTEERSYGLEAAVVRGPFHMVGEAHWLEAELPGTGTGPRFFGAYVEAGVFLTGESRGYGGGRWNRTEVERPLGGGGIGAVQLNLRYDHLDLRSRGVNGGVQDALAASLVWIPQDHLRFLVNAIHIRYEDAAIAGAGGQRDYGVTVFGARAQIDF